MPTSSPPRPALVIIDMINALDFPGGASLLRHVTGVAGDSCVLATATDAHMRHFEVHVPADCTASITQPRNDRALGLLKQSLQIDTRIAARIKLT